MCAGIQEQLMAWVSISHPHFMRIGATVLAIVVSRPTESRVMYASCAVYVPIPRKRHSGILSVSCVNTESWLRAGRT
jgi:hypothetical protein